MQAINYPPSVAELYSHLSERLKDVVPDAELRFKAELATEINRLKREKRAIILGHNYMEPALFHSVPDFVGDSLQLSRIAAQADADRIIFCGVKFMAETAKILNPQRIVLLPSAKGGCSLAEAITAADVLALRALYPQAVVVTYVNTYADVKAESDYCCTSGNADAVVRQLRKLGHKQIIFLPDEYLAKNVAATLHMPIIFPTRQEDGNLKAAPFLANDEPVIIGWRGRCEVHEKFTVDDIRDVRRQFPDAVVLAHPECSPEVVSASDFAGSTSEMIRYIENMKAGRYLLLTECSMGDNIASQNPKREMIRLCRIRCPHMNEITLEETLESLKQDRYQITVPEEIRKRAQISLERMISIG